ncbi:MAG: hypothetical protein IJZ30_02895 [Alphaproteobacteria bacterium]|nr:hypothetical protein [Alphaproteobacteria bacterium]
MTERKKLDGKNYVKALGACQTKEDVLELLGRTLGSEKMKDRAKNVSDLPHVVKLKSKVALLNTMQGKDTSNQDCMDMAAEKYLSLTGGDIKRFKLEVNKYATQMDIQKEKTHETKGISVDRSSTQLAL